MKHQMSGFDVAALVRELDVLTGAYVTKIWHRPPDQLLIRLNLPGTEGKHNLLIDTKKWMGLVKEPGQNPTASTTFAMLLRKVLGNARIVSITQHSFDRVVTIKISKDQEYSLMVELFGDGNIILVNAEGTIIAPMRTQSWRHRQLRPKHTYSYPPSRFNPVEADTSCILEILENGEKDLVRTLAMDVNLGGIYAEEVCYLAQVEKDTAIAEVPPGKLEEVSKLVREVLGRLETPVAFLVANPDQKTQPENDDPDQKAESGDEGTDQQPQPEDEGADDQDQPEDEENAQKAQSEDEGAGDKGQPEGEENGQKAQSKGEDTDQQGQPEGEETAQKAQPKEDSTCHQKQPEAESTDQIGRFSDVVPIHLDMLSDRLVEKRESLSQALEEYFAQLPGAQVVKQVDPEVARLARQRENQASAIEALLEDIDTLTKVSEFYYERFQDCEALLGQANIAFGTDGWKAFMNQLKSSFEVIRVDMAKKTMILKLDNLNIPFHILEDVNSNAQHAYERLRRSKDKLTGARKALDDTDKDLVRGEKKAKRKEIEKEKSTRKKTFWFERYRWFFSSSGNLIIGGRDQKTNDKLVKKHLKGKDRYAHADITGAPSIVMKDEGEGVDELTLKEGCHFALIHSKAWSVGLGAASAYWVKPDQVSKTAQAGEFVPKGAFIIRGKRNYMHDMPLRAGVGVFEHKGETMVFCGPVSAVKHHCQKVIEITPGPTKKTQAGKLLASRLEVGNLDEMLSALPPGDIMILE